MARTTTEVRLERSFVKWAKEKDIVPIKGPSHLAKGFPDRFFQLPNGGGTIYVEFKGTSKAYDLLPMQRWWKEYLLESNPNRYFVVETQEQLDKLIEICEAFIAIGPAVVEYEQELLNVFNKNK